MTHIIWNPQTIISTGMLAGFIVAFIIEKVRADR